MPRSRLSLAVVKALLRDFLAARSPKTSSCYRTDYAYFAGFIHAENTESAILSLLTAGDRQAELLVEQFRSKMLGGDVAQATVSRRLAALRSIVKCARVASLIDWHLRVENSPITPRATPTAKWRTGRRS